MSAVVGVARREGARVADAWYRFWFEPRPTSTLALFRIVYGTVVALWALALLPDSRTFLSREGVLPHHPSSRPLRSYTAVLMENVDPALIVGALVVVGVLLALGTWTRVMTVLNFVLLFAITHRNPQIVNSGDSLLRHFGFFLMFAPAGAAFSVDRLRVARHDFWAVPRRAPWALRMIQIQVSMVYFFSTFAKVQGPDWVRGEALAQVWRLGQYVRFEVPFFLYDSMLASNLATYATLVVELALALLIWNRVARPYVIVAGILLHLGIETTMAVGFFSTAVVMGYLSFLSEDRANQLIGWVRRRTGRTFGGGRRHAAVT